MEIFVDGQNIKNFVAHSNANDLAKAEFVTPLLFFLLNYVSKYKTVNGVNVVGEGALSFLRIVLRSCAFSICCKMKNMHRGSARLPRCILKLQDIILRIILFSQ